MNAKSSNCSIVLVLCWLALSSESIAAHEPDPLALNFHLMHPGGDSRPGDPNAAFHLDGTYHLHYIMSHPWEVDGRTRKSFSYVHVTSPDMLHWTWQTTKLKPSFTGHGMYSGTGFLTKEGKPAIIYHGAGSGRNQIAIAKDRKLSAWEKPFPVEPKTPDGQPANIKHWDPDCFRIGDAYYAISGGRNPPLLKSSDLTNWTYVGDFMSHELDDVAIGEDISCANFFPLGDRWMLLCISHTHGCRYYLGDWDSEKEQFVPVRHGRMNWPQEGQSPHVHLSVRDCFAPESVLTPDGRRVMWAWLATVDERLLAETIQSLPRELSLADDGSLRIKPARELKKLRHSPRVFENFTVAPKLQIAGGSVTKHIFDMDGDAWEIRLTVSRKEAMRKRFGLRLFADDEHEGLPIMIQPASRTMRIGTTEIPFAVANLPDDEDLELRIFIDKYLVEVFATNRQAHVAAHLDGRNVRGVEAYAWGAPVTFKKIELWKMKTTNQGYHKARQNRIWEPDSLEAPPTSDTKR